MFVLRDVLSSLGECQYFHTFEIEVCCTIGSRWREIMQYKDVQNIAKMTIQFIKENIQPGMTLIEIRDLCETKMIELGADSFWYWDVGAFVFAGDETTLSVSGKEYTTSERVIAENDIITIDLSPQNGDIWGDYARTIIIEMVKLLRLTMYLMRNGRKVY